MFAFSRNKISICLIVVISHTFKCIDRSILLTTWLTKCPVSEQTLKKRNPLQYGTVKVQWIITYLTTIHAPTKFRRSTGSTSSLPSAIEYILDDEFWLVSCSSTRSNFTTCIALTFFTSMAQNEFVSLTIRLEPVKFLILDADTLTTANVVSCYTCNCVLLLPRRWREAFCNQTKSASPASLLHVPCYFCEALDLSSLLLLLSSIFAYLYQPIRVLSIAGQQH